jgi:hypothetical protein
MKVNNWFEKMIRPVRFSNEEDNIKGGILFIGTSACLIGLIFLISVHIFDPLFSLLSPAFICAVALSGAIILVCFKKLTAASYLLLISLLGFILYQLAFQINGIHETAILVLPGLLILASLLLKKWEFSVFTMVILISISIILWREKAGIHITPFSGRESNYFGIDILVILACTAISIGILAKSYMQNLIP